MNQDDTTKMNAKSTKRAIGTIALATAAAAAIAGGTFLSPNDATAEAPKRLNNENIARVDELASAMKQVGKAVEPSVVSIEVEKRAGNRPGGGRFDEDMLRRFFPDTDGDGQPDLPPGLRLPGQGGDQGNGSDTPRRRVYGEGSGVIVDVDGDKAYVVTNNHVAGDATKMTVTLADGRRIDDVKLVGADPLSDLAVLEIKSEKLVGLRWGDSSTIEKGDIVLAFGSPFGYVGSMTQGIVSALNRNAGVLGRGGYENFIQTDCAINPGNSGGPLVNIHGEIVGINTAIASTTGGFNGIGFAIPADLAKYVYTELKETGKVTRGYLGVQISDASALPKKQAELLELGDNPRGAFVSILQNGTPAAGKLQPNDVIVKINGKEIASRDELRLKIATSKPGSVVKLGIIRDGKPQEVEVTLGTLPGPDQPVAAVREQESNPPTQLGATLDNANAARLKASGLPEDAKGALVVGVKAGSPAQQAGLETGDLIQKIGDKTINNAADAAAALKSSKLSEGVLMSVQNKEGTKSVFIQVEGD